MGQKRMFDHLVKKTHSYLQLMQSFADDCSSCKAKLCAAGLMDAGVCSKLITKGLHWNQTQNLLVQYWLL